ncbi:MAG: SRPBCC domain-containing protein [Acidimicrobiales bacterium]
MQITIDKDPAARTMVVTVELAATVERSWQLWADPRQLERWWGPPSHPATVVEHDLAPGATVRYFMTGPEGDKYHGRWDVVAVEPPHRLELVDSFADDGGEKDESLPSTRMTMDLAERAGGGTTMTMRSEFASVEAMEQILAMGMEEGLREALGQIDAILATPV